jgi:hypothetical protein
MVDLRTAPPPKAPAPRPPQRGRRGPLIVLIVLLAVGMAAVVVWAVSSGGDAGMKLEEPPPPEDTASASVEQEILAAWSTFRDALDEVNSEKPDPNDPRLARYATGEMLEDVRAAAEQNRAQGIVTRLPENSISQVWPEVISVEGDTAQLRSCEVDDGLVVKAETGDTVNPPGAVTLLVEATLIRDDQGWKVSESVLVEEWEGLVLGDGLDEHLGAV